MNYSQPPTYLCPICQGFAPVTSSAQYSTSTVTLTTLSIDTKELFQNILSRHFQFGCCHRKCFQLSDSNFYPKSSSSSVKWIFNGTVFFFVRTNLFCWGIKTVWFNHRKGMKYFPPSKAWHLWKVTGYKYNLGRITNWLIQIPDRLNIAPTLSRLASLICQCEDMTQFSS